MKKNKLFTLIIIALITCLFMTFTACGDGDKPEEQPTVTPPVASDWASAGLGNAFGANVTGELTSNFVEEGDIFMSWEGSDRASFDDTVNWLQSQGYNTFGGSGAEIETDEGIISYISEKTFDSGTKVVEVVFVTQDMTVAGQTLKAGDLYFSIEEKETVTPSTPGQTATWPANQIQTALGVSIPEYTGEVSSFVFSDGSYGTVKNIAITCFGATTGADANYIGIITQNGYVKSDDFYVKRLNNGDSVEMYVEYGQTINPNTYQMDNALMISVLYNKNSGEFTAWSQLDFSDFTGVTIPAYNGGTSFDFMDITESEKQGYQSGLQSAIDVLARYENTLTEEQKAELDALRAKLPYVAQISAVTVTVYGTNSEQTSAYQSALESAGFVSGEKNTADFEYAVDFGYVDQNGKLVITYTKIPQALLEGDSNGGGAQQPTSFYTMPENVKIVYTYGLAGSTTSTITIIKIGDDYYRQEKMSGIVMEESYYKKNGNAWDVYVKEYMESWTKDSEQESDGKYVERRIFDFIVIDAGVTEYDDVEKGERQTIVGREVDVYTQYGNTTYYKDVATGLILKYAISYSGSALEYTVTSFDLTVTAFEGVTLPE